MELVQVALMDIRLKAQNALLQNNRPEIRIVNNSTEKFVSNVLLDLISTLRDCANFLMRLALLTTRSPELALLAIQATKFAKESAKSTKTLLSAIHFALSSKTTFVFDVQTSITSKKMENVHASILSVLLTIK
jgi:hypothetical protein